MEQLYVCSTSETSVTAVAKWHLLLVHKCQILRVFLLFWYEGCMAREVKKIGGHFLPLAVLLLPLR